MTGFLDPYLVDCRLPYRRVAAQSWPGRGLCVVSRAEIPHGGDRAVFLWAATMAQVRGLAFTFRPLEVAAMFGLDWKHDEVLTRLHRVSSTHIEATRRESDRHWVQVHVAIEQLEVTATECFIKLGTQFAPDRLIPVVRDVLVGCVQRRRLAALDLYLWQSMAARACQTTQQIEVFGEGGVLHQLGCMRRDPRKARQQLRTRQALIKELWPECPHYLTPDANQFVIEPSE